MIHLVTTLSNKYAGYPATRILQGIFKSLPEPKRVYQKRLSGLTSYKIFNNLGSKSISNIHILFINLQVEIKMGDLFSSLDVLAINGYPHAILEKTLAKLPTFQANSVVATTFHYKSIFNCHTRFFIIPNMNM